MSALRTAERRKNRRKWGGWFGENIHELEENAKILKKINTISVGSELVASGKELCEAEGLLNLSQFIISFPIHRLASSGSF